MNSESKNIDIITHIQRYCEEIEGTLSYFDNSKEEFDQNFVFRNACTMCVLQIGELVGHLSEDFKNQYSNIPWRDIKGIRNYIAHSYLRIDFEEVWDTLNNDVPELHEFCTSITNQYSLFNQNGSDFENDGDELEP